MNAYLPSLENSKLDWLVWIAWKNQSIINDNK